MGPAGFPAIPRRGKSDGTETSDPARRTADLPVPTLAGRRDRCLGDRDSLRNRRDDSAGSDLRQHRAVALARPTHAQAALTFTIHYAGGELGVPSPLRRAVLKLPAGLTLDIPELRSCSAARLQSLGVRGCPAHSEIGGGHALVESNLGSGAPRGARHAVGLSRAAAEPPADVRDPGRGLLAAQRADGAHRDLAPRSRSLRGRAGDVDPPDPHGARSSPMPSVVTFSLTIGASRLHRRGRRGHGRRALHCPAGGLPFAAEFTYADGSSGSALATIPCPL